MASWQRVFKSEKLHRAEIVKSYLEDKHLQPILIDKKDSAYQFGHYEVLVAADEVLQALKLIEDDIHFE